MILKEYIANDAFAESVWDIWLQPILTRIKVDKKYNYDVIYTYIKDNFIGDLDKTIKLYQDLLDIEHGISELKGVYSGSETYKQDGQR